LQWLVDSCPTIDTIDDLLRWVDAIAVTDTPWLPWSLIIGRTLASFLSHWYDKPLLLVNHLHGHIFSFLLSRQVSIIHDKNLVLSVSGWHSDLSILLKNMSIFNWLLPVFVDKIWHYCIQKIGTTRDDAIGEVYDKISRLLWWPYPWWVWISTQADFYTRSIPNLWSLPLIQFKRIMLESWSFDFSFSGMKAQAYTFIEKYKILLWLWPDDVLSESVIQHICYEFQEAATDILVKKSFLAISHYNIELIALVGGVSANTRLRTKMIEYRDQYNIDNWKNVQFYTPESFDYCTDNAAMVGVAGIISVS
jgi:N6-L-threonylcarbamoyladenine synthase